MHESRLINIAIKPNWKEEKGVIELSNAELQGFFCYNNYRV